MKIAILFLTLMISSSFANTIESVYKKSSILPKDLKGAVMESVLGKFSCITASGLEEIKTTVKEDIVDQGVIDQYYTTIFNADHSEDQHPAISEVIVKSALFSGANPKIDWGEILKVSGDIDCEKY